MLSCGATPNRDVRSGCRSNSTALPVELLLRELRVHVRQRGFRSKTVVIVTTLVDNPGDSGGRDRGSLPSPLAGGTATESLKVVLQMDHLRCKETAPRS